MAKTRQNTIPTLMTIISLITILSLLNLSVAHNGQYYKNLSPKKLGLKQEKLTHLHFYFHDIVSGPNPTAVRVAAAQSTNSSSTGFGFVAVMDDPLTEGPEPNSRPVGRAQGIYSSASQSDVGLLMVLNYVFTEGEFNGSTLSILGRNAVFSAVREMPIVGGSGLFRFARGYAQARTHWFNLTSGDAVVEYNVYVLHY
ncbi:Disease resistance response protein [Trema orientale]|uniref:Dirigent protein n=1 Tax=Trema orientale TaxID=63057 RepID=A0A2P5AGV0_TREOI|nr:Disease resistance response protein [Trema orientale]PON36254.1 Disease resistance response protein [Trema orientale]